MHNVLGVHRPIEDASRWSYNGESFVANCRDCGRRILQDSQGNWFEAWRQ